MVQSTWTTEIDLPLLSPAGRRRFIFAVRKHATRIARKRIVTPNRKRAPRNTGALRKSIRAKGRPRKQRGTPGFVTVHVEGAFYWRFQDRQWREFLLDMQRYMPDVIEEAVALALKDEGY